MRKPAANASNKSKYLKGGHKGERPLLMKPLAVWSAGRNGHPGTRATGKTAVGRGGSWAPASPGFRGGALATGSLCPLEATDKRRGLGNGRGDARGHLLRDPLAGGARSF